MKKKIAFLVSEDWYFLSHRLDFCLFLLKNNYEVTLISNFSEHRDYLKKKGLSTIQLKINRSKLNPFLDIFSMLKLVKIYKEINPDVLHHVALKPVIIGSVSSFFIKEKKVINALGGLGWLFTSKSRKAYIIVYLVKIILSKILKVGNVIVQNKYDKSLLRKIGLPDRNTHIIEGVGIDLKKYKQKIISKSKYINISLIGRILEDKGINEFVEAAKLIKLDEAYKNINFTLVGKFDLLNPSNIDKNQVEKWQSQNIINYIGWVSNINDYLQEVDVICLPSYREGLPHILVEAMASGLPIITTDVPGCNSLVENKFNGFLVQPRDYRELHLKIIEMINNFDLRVKMGKRSRAISENRFDDKLIFKQLIGLYDL